MKELKNEIRKAIGEILNSLTHNKVVRAVVSAFEYPDDSKNGDIAFKCFKLTLDWPEKKSPAEIASFLAHKLSLSSRFARVEAKGPYLNFFLDREKFLESVLDNQVKGQESSVKSSRAQRVMVEYVSPNNNKPLHLGHVRNGLLGEAVSNLLISQGHEVVRALLLNDRGLAIAKAMVAYAKWGEGRTPESSGLKGDHLVAEYYVMYEKKLKEDATLEAEAHEVIRKWEAGDAETRKLWQTMNDWCEKGQHETYKKLGFRFDVEYKESEIYLLGKDIVEDGLKSGIFVKDESGAVVAPLEAHGLPDKVVLRADGTSLYITQDLYLAKKKFEGQKIDRSVYVVGNEQNLQFKQLFKILELLGYDWAARMTHLSYGYVTLPEGRMKSREGTVVDADDLITELETEAAMEIKQRHPAILDDELVRRAHQLAMAALKFHFLEIDIASDTVYDPKASLSFTGKTGPYLQYMHARVRSILRKAGESADAAYEGRNPAPEEHALALLVAKYPETVRRAATELRPSLVAGHLYDTAKSLASFYERCQVLNASSEDRAVRLKLIEAAAAILKNGLNLLGIEAPEEM